MKPITNKGYQLLHNGTIALSQVEANGIRVDTNYLNRAINHTKQQIEKITIKMKQDRMFKLWQKKYGTKTNMGSRNQLGTILFSIMKYPCEAHTDSGRPKTDETALGKVNLPFVRNFLKLERLKKTNSTYLQGILRETTNGFLHPFFNLNFARTYRSSSDHPNFQNMPIRNPQTAKLVRRAFISRPGHQIVETDYNGAEIRCAVCYHKDPRMISYIKDGKKDLHRDMAGQCFYLPKNQITKDVRFCGKNMFVFPQFYGDYYLRCAENLWKAIGQMKLKRKDGIDLYQHLKNKGIYKLGKCNPKESPVAGTFEHHLQKVEDMFWNDWFKVYQQWKEKWYTDYVNRGYFDTLTGFRIEGFYNRKEVINYPVQGSAFHWLLWSLIRIQKLLKKYKMKTLIIGQIHDSIVADVFKKELKTYLEIVNQVMTIDIRKHWKWIIVPLSIENEASPVNGNWYEKKLVN